MSQHSTDAEARLRAADPAAGSEPDLVALRAAVDRRVQAGAVTDDLAVRRSRTPWPVRVVSAAAAALVIGGGGGYAIGVAGGSGADSGSVLTSEEGWAPDAADSPQGIGPSAVPGAGRGGVENGAADEPWSGYSGRAVFRQSGLSTEGGTAPMHGLDAQSAFSEEAAARAAEVLGVEGAPRLVDGMWFVGESGAPEVQLYPDGTVSLSYWDPSKDPWSCAGAVLEDDGATADEVRPGEPCEERDLGPAPTGEAATDLLEQILEGVGLDVDDWEVEVETWGDDTWSYVTAHHVLDGRRTGLQWNGSLSGAGLQSLYGATAPVVELGDYEVISPAAAVERLMDPRFADSGPTAWVEGREPGDARISSPRAPGAPDTPVPGATVSWPVHDVEVVEARLAGAQHWQPDGTVLLVPTYELTDSDGAIWTVVAVAESHLDLTDR